MPRSTLSLTVVAAAVALTATGIALAGGWAVATVHPLGSIPVAGKPTTLTLSVRQHGRTLVRVDDVALEIVARDGARTRFPARPLQRTGTYAADVTFPAAGTYRWRAVKGWFGPQELGRIRVAAAGRVLPAGPALDGRSLFLAKGCGTCHFGPDSEAQVDVGPSLRNLAERFSGKAGLAYLRQSIKKPDAVIAGGDGGTFSGRMPLLEVSAAEADAIARYLVSRKQ